MKIVGYGVAALGTAYVVKQVRRRKESSRGWHKIKVEEKQLVQLRPMKHR